MTTRVYGVHGRDTGEDAVRCDVLGGASSPNPARSTVVARAIAAALCVTVVAIGSPALRAATPAEAEREIGALISALGASACKFERNGTWHDASAAQAHLRKKYAYLRKRGLAPDAEAFIERAASTSSLSGKAYRVRCGAAAPVASAAWLRARLDAIRRGTSPSR